MQTVSVTIDRFVEDKFEHLLNEYGYEFSKHYDCSDEDLVVTTRAAMITVTMKNSLRIYLILSQMWMKYRLCYGLKKNLT